MDCDTVTLSYKPIGLAAPLHATFALYNLDCTLVASKILHKAHLKEKSFKAALYEEKVNSDAFKKLLKLLNRNTLNTQK